MFKWMRLRRDELTTCACEPEWPGLETELDGHRMRAEPSPEGSTPMVLMLGLRAYCTRCRARYPFGWTVGDRG